MTGFAKYRRSPFATMVGVVLLVAVVFWLLAHPAGSGAQNADFAALAADPGCTAEVRATNEGFTLTVDLADPARDVGQAVYTGDYGSIRLSEVTDADATGCTLHFTAGGSRDGSKAHLVTGIAPAPNAGAGNCPYCSSVLAAAPEGCTARFVEAETQYTAAGNEFAIRLEAAGGTDAQHITVQVDNLPEVMFTPAQ